MENGRADVDQSSLRAKLAVVYDRLELNEILQSLLSRGVGKRRMRRGCCPPSKLRMWTRNKASFGGPPGGCFWPDWREQQPGYIVLSYASFTASSHFMCCAVRWREMKRSGLHVGGGVADESREDDPVHYRFLRSWRASSASCLAIEPSSGEGSESPKSCLERSWMNLFKPAPRRAVVEYEERSSVRPMLGKLVCIRQLPMAK
jgi:hypothetical protein